MSTVAPPPDPTALPPAPFPDLRTLADLVERLGGIPLERIRLHPLPGTATERDVEAAENCELIDGVLVEKAMGFFESRLGVVLAYFVEAFLEQQASDPGFTLGADAPELVVPGQVRKPDFSLYLWDRFPGRVLPATQVLRMAPDWAVEVLSPDNTVAEIDRKRRECFQGGTRLFWQVYPKRRAVRVYTAVDHYTEVGEDGTLDGGEVLPGFRLSVRQWFERAGRGLLPA